MARRCAVPPKDDWEWSLLGIFDNGIDVTAAFAENGDLAIRLFNAEGDSAARRITLDGRVRRVRLVELDGRLIEELPVDRGADGRATVAVAMGRFAVRTLRCTLR